MPRPTADGRGPIFNWTGLSTWIAIKGAEGLEATGVTGFGAILCFIVLAFLINLFIITAGRWPSTTRTSR